MATLDADDIAAITRAVLGVGGTTYYVSKTGADASDGLTPATAKLTVGSVLSAGTPLAGDGDLVLIGAGQYDEEVVILFPEGVTVRGGGRGATTVSVDCGNIDETYGFVIAGHRVRLTDFTMESLGSGLANDTNGGNNIQIGLASTLVEGVVLERMHVYGESDALRGYFTGLRVKDCLFSGRWDGVVFDGACKGQFIDTTIDLPDPKAPTASNVNTSVAGSEIDLIRCVLTASGASQTVSAIKATADVTYRIIDTTIDVSQADPDSLAIENVGSVASILAANSSYDATQVTGTVTAIPTHTLGSIEDGVVNDTGDGDTAVNHDYGSTDALRVTLNGSGVDNAAVRAYLTADYAAGTFTVRGLTHTGTDGRFIAPLMLDAGAYTLVVSKPGVIQAKEVEVTVA